MNRNIVALTLLLSLTTGTIASATVPTQMTVQGRLTDLDGIPLPAGTKALTFRIFSDTTGGTQIWPASGQESQSVTSANDGLWIAMVGALVPLTDSVFSNPNRWLEVSVNMTIMPRIRLATSPFAHRVSTVDGAKGGHIASKVTIGPGHANSGTDAFVAGAENQVTGNFSVVGGGVLNNATGESSAISGGQQNSASKFGASVGGGQSNAATGQWSRVDGGNSNLASDTGATVGGGGYNRARGYYSTVAGGGGASPGDSNAAPGRWSAVGGGTENVAGGWASVVAGGFVNYATGEAATIGGGVANFVYGTSAVIAGGNSSYATAPFSTVGGGLNNRVTDSGSVVSGGANNRCHGLYSVIGGGGGADPIDSNSIESQWSTIGGGARNKIDTGIYCTIGGGIYNKAQAFGSTVSGGGHNLASGTVSTVAGGEFNNASNYYATVGGGYQNIAQGEYSTIPGGFHNRANGNYSFAAGEDARAHHNNSFIWGDGTTWLFDSAATTSSNQFIIMCSGNVGIGTSTPIDKLHIHNGNIRTNGCVIGSNIVCPSDARLKEDIHTLDHALDRVGQLRGVEYKWSAAAKQKGNLSDTQQIGLIAQEVRDVVPQAVIEQSDGYLAVDYARLVPLLIEGMKEQQRIIEQQNSRITKLEQRLEQ